jgi:peptidoglycan/LPS O-acetylase OafA/YrhL
MLGGRAPSTAGHSRLVVISGAGPGVRSGGLIQEGRSVRSPGFNLGVHGARGLFAFAVFVFHVVNSGLPTLPALQGGVVEAALRSTEYGVELFFCISGFVIAGTLRRAATPLSFLEDRAIRIYPVLGLSILAIVALGVASGAHGFAELGWQRLAWMVPVNMLAIPGVVPLDNLHPAAWSLSYEMCFYLFCALCWAARPALGRALPFVAAVPAVLFVVMLPRGAFLAAGVLVALGLPRAPALRWPTLFPGVMLLLFLACWRGVQELTLPRHIVQTTLLDWAQDARLPLAVLAFGFAVLGFRGLVDGHGALVRLLRTRPLLYLGTISYSFYLWHPIVMSVVKAGLLRSGAAAAAGPWAQALFFLVALPPALAVSHVSQRVLERWLAARLRRRLHHPPPGSETTIAMERA